MNDDRSPRLGDFVLYTIGEEDDSVYGHHYGIARGQMYPALVVKRNHKTATISLQVFLCDQRMIVMLKKDLIVDGGRTYSREGTWHWNMGDQ